MAARTIDFLGIIALDRKVIEQLEYYLQEKENRLAAQILHIIQVPESEMFNPVLPPGQMGLKLSDAVETFTKRIRAMGKEHIQLPNGDVNRVIEEINAAFWEFTEVLEGCSVELFQQVRQVNIDRWHVSLSHVVQTIKEMIIHRIEDLAWTIRRLEEPLRDYRKQIGVEPASSGWRAWFEKEKSVLDPHLLGNLEQTKAYLRTQYEDFHRRYEFYVLLSVKVEELLEKMKSYPVLALLDIHEQNIYVDLFRLLKMWELNPYPKGPLAEETARSLKNLVGFDTAFKVLQVYFRELKEAFFTTSLELKGYRAEHSDMVEERKKIYDKLVNYRTELQQLTSTLSHYRHFILKTDSNPYVRSRWGFGDRPVAAEPPKAKKILSLVYKGEELQGWYNQFLHSVKEHMEAEGPRSTSSLRQQIDKLLHEMGQPLISQIMMRSRSEKLLEQMKAFNEIGSEQQEAIDFIEGTLSKAMREDWKYHTLHEFPLFHELYYLHTGLVRYPKDPSHAFRLDRFKRLFGQIEDWVQQGDLDAHNHEIELDINDMKTYLQDFFATIQRAAKEKAMDPFLDETVARFRHQLLEYRYMFGDFVFHLVNKNRDSQQLRNQFLFVDQYFESIENLLNEMSENY